jgi:hypothetical protein
MTLLACSSPLACEPRFEGSADVMHRTACLSEIDRLESGRRPSHDPQMPLGFLNEVEERVAVLIGRGLGRGERAFERDKRGDQVTSMVGRACRSA